MLKITNTQPGPRGINAVSGPVLIEPGETREVEVYAREREHIKATGWFEVKGDYTPNPDASTAKSGDEEAAIKALADRDARIAELEAQLAAKADAAKPEGGAKGAK